MGVESEDIVVVCGLYVLEENGGGSRDEVGRVWELMGIGGGGMVSCVIETKREGSGETNLSSLRQGSLYKVEAIQSGRIT